jgi:hypothetical protein
MRKRRAAALMARALDVRLKSVTLVGANTSTDPVLSRYVNCPHTLARPILRSSLVFLLAQRDMRAIERANKQRRKEAPKIARLEREGESDDEVRGNIPPDLVPLFERVKRQIKAAPRMTRTEAFFKYAEEHPDEVLIALDDKTDAVIRELEEQERQARRELRSGPPRVRYTPEQLAEVPF